MRPQSSITRLMVAPSSCCSAQSWPLRVRWQYSVAASMTNMSSSSERSQVFQRVTPSGFWKNCSSAAMRALDVGVDRWRCWRLSFGCARPDAPALALHLVLARLDDEAKQIVGVGETAQLGKADRLVGARPGDEIVAGRKIEAPAGDVRRRDRPQRIERTEPVGAGAARDAMLRFARHRTPRI